MTAREVVDRLYPLTKEDERCGFKKAKKLRARADLLQAISDYRDGKQVVLTAEVKRLLDD